jgi:hypothetical protein
MAKMIRKQIYMQEEQDKFLKSKAQELRITEAEVVREALDSFQAYGYGTAAILDPSGWVKEREFLTQLLGTHIHQPSDEPVVRTWKREDLYER